MIDYCVWCYRRIWFWQKWEWTRTQHCEVGSGWVCSINCWDWHVEALDVAE